MTSVVPHEGNQSYELEPVTHAREIALRLAKPFPGPRRMAAVALWWLRTGARIVPWIPTMVLAEIRPIFRGFGRLAVGWARWASCSDLAEAIRNAEGNERSKAAERYEKRKSARIWGSLAFFVLFLGGLVWLYFAEQSAFWLTLIVFVLVCDAVGHRGEPKPDPLPFAMPSQLGEGVPLTQLTRTIIETLHREGFEEGTVQVAAPMRWDQSRKEYRVRIKTADKIEPKHIQAIERSIGADDYAIRNLATGTAAIRELVIRVGDPLANLVERPWVETGSRSVAQPLELGVSMTEVPFALPFAGVHMRIVAGTGGGKTKWILRSIIDALSSCHDVVIAGIDLSNGPEMTLWRDVIQYKGFTVEAAEEVLDLAIAEIERRSRILTEIAEDDDPTNDTDEWHSGLGPAFIVLADEFSMLAQWDGKKETPDGRKPNLLAKAEQIVRTGRKHWVSLVMLTQRTGNADFGSSVMSSQCGVSIAGPCDQADAVRMFSGELRDAGWTPHHLSPGVEGEIRDAGKVFIQSPMHRTPDVYRCFAPGSTAEVKRRAKQRVTDGLPRLHSKADDVIDAVEIPTILAAVERVFGKAGDPEKLPTVEIVAALREEGFDFPEDEVTAARRLAEQLRPHGLGPRDTRWRPEPHANPVRGYWLDDVRAVIRSIS